MLSHILFSGYLLSLYYVYNMTYNSQTLVETECYVVTQYLNVDTEDLFQLTHKYLVYVHNDSNINTTYRSNTYYYSLGEYKNDINYYLGNHFTTEGKRWTKCIYDTVNPSNSLKVSFIYHEEFILTMGLIFILSLTLIVILFKH
jgi:hypothetical protein